MKKIVQIITLLGLACICGQTIADEILLNAKHPQRHVVVKGDTLWDISAKFLQHPWQWPQLWQLNRAQINNPHWIYPGDVLVLDHVNGQPMLRLMRDSVLLEPGVIITPIKAEAIPAIQPNVILPFLIKPMLMTADALAHAPRIIAGQEEREILSTGTRIYVQDLPNSPAANWAIYHEGEAIKDPATGESLGLEVLYLGEAKLVRAGQPATLDITQAQEEIAVKDKLAPIQEAPSQVFIPHAPNVAVKGLIAGVRAGINETGAGRVVVLNIGERNGIESGHVLTVLRKGLTVPDPVSDAKLAKSVQLPDEPVGMVMVFKTFERLSYALVMQASQAIRIEDVVKTP